MISVVSDHGEALGDHGETAHGVFLYDDTIHVPLVIKLPKGVSSEKQVERRAMLVDIAPTILQTVGLPVPKEMQGESQLVEMGAVPGAKGVRRSLCISETLYPRKAFGFSAVRALRSDKYRLFKLHERAVRSVGRSSGAARLVRKGQGSHGDAGA